MKSVAALILQAAVAAMLFTGCRVSDVREATIIAPDVRNEACQQVVLKALKALPGSESLEIVTADFATGTIVVRYDSMKVGTKNLEDAIAQAGFAAGPFPANPEAASKLPPECRVAGD